MKTTSYSSRAERLLARPDLAAYTEPGREYAYRPSQILCAIDDEPLLVERLSASGKMIAPGVWTTAENVHELVIELRRLADVRTPRVGPNHLLFGAPRFLGVPATDPAPAAAADLVRRKNADAGAGVNVVVIDTGLDAEARTLPLLRAVDAEDPDDIDLTGDVVPDDGFLDDQAGHGAFVAGIIRQYAPGASVRVVKALDTDGVTDEVTVAKAIRRAAAAGADIINLSLGGFTHGDVPPVVLTDALDSLPPDVVVVGAAGNESQTRPFWPAALKRVIAVGAVDESGRPATFTNRGWWVDVCARGTEVASTYVSGTGNPANDPRGEAEAFDGYATWSGTSFAAPLVAAAIAVEREAGGGGGSNRQAALRVIERATTDVPELGVLVAV